MNVAADCGQRQNCLVCVADILVFSVALMVLKHTSSSDGEQSDEFEWAPLRDFFPILATAVVVFIAAHCFPQKRRLLPLHPQDSTGILR